MQGMNKTFSFNYFQPLRCLIYSEEKHLLKNGDVRI